MAINRDKTIFIILSRSSHEIIQGSDLCILKHKYLEESMYLPL